MYFIYILSNKRNGALYIGMTNDLVRRVFEHKNNYIKGFTSKYGVHKLVYYEQCDSFDSALQREKQIKEWRRSWKLDLVEKANPLWKDLFDELVALS